MTDEISKAKFVLWRDRFDVDLEEFPNFGPDIDGVLRRARLQQSLIKPEDIAKYAEQVKTEGVVPAPFYYLRHSSYEAIGGAIG